MQGYFNGLMQMTGISFGQESAAPGRAGSGRAAPQPIHWEETAFVTNEGNRKGCPYTGRTRMSVGAGLAPALRWTTFYYCGILPPEVYKTKIYSNNILRRTKK